MLQLKAGFPGPSWNVRGGLIHATMQLMEALDAAAAWRGGVEEPEDRLLAAGLRAMLAGLADDEVWPEEAQVDIRRAIELDPLFARARHAQATQLANSGAEAEAAQELANLQDPRHLYVRCLSCATVR